MRKDITISKLAKAMNRLGYSVFETDTKAYNLNIVGVRSSNPIVNEFNDLMCVF